MQCKEVTPDQVRGRLHRDDICTTANNIKKFYLLIIPSILTFPGPQNNNVVKAARYMMASSDSIKGLSPFAPNIATSIVTINGITAKRVNKPSTINKEQSTSAKMDNNRDVFIPKPRK